MKAIKNSFKILIVDDTPEDQELYKRLLALDAGNEYTITTADTGEEGLERLRKLGPDCVILDYNLPDMNGLTFLSFLHEEERPSPVAVVMVTGEGNETVAVQAMKKGAQDYLVKDSIKFEQMQRAVANAIEKVGLVKELGQKAEELEFMAFHDPLTDLPNRNLFYDRLNHALRLARRRDESVCLLLLDLDRFKLINDCHGHAAGDFVLREIGTRLRIQLREADTVARLGGDEFAVILQTGATLEGAEITALKIIRAVELPMMVEGQRVDVGVSIGIAAFPEHGTDADELLHSADAAMYRAKRDGTRVMACGSDQVQPSVANLRSV